MLEKIKNYQPKFVEIAKAVQDVRVLGIAMFAVVALLISWSGIKVIGTNYGLQKDIARLQQENGVRQLQNKNLQLENEFFKTDEYLELQARQNFGLAAPGETVVVVPKTVAMKYIKPVPKTAEEIAKKSQPKYQQNLQAWLKFLRHKSS